MTLLVLLVLAALWAAVLVPPVLRSRSRRSADSIGDFEHRLGVLRRTNGSVGPAPLPAVGEARMPFPPDRRRPGGALGGARRRETLRRRQNTLATLVVAAAVTLVGAALGGDPTLWALHLLVDGALVAYLGLLVHYRSAAGASAVVAPAPVHRLHPPASADDGGFVLRRVADL